ncbi:MAG: M20 family metallopeptidase [Synergistaceae bacterium]|jgi:amidohydrolase|nr:M20 family metallopeptidase [Synergistaceae bacterium]
MNQEGKRIVEDALEVAREALLKLSHDIHSNPELGFEEHKAAQWQVEFLKERGFTVEIPYCGLATAYRASRSFGSGKPRIAFMAEYDALAGAGHACGHNIIASSALGAGIALAQALSEAKVDGEVLVIGTPGEEGQGGKVHLVEKGAFDDVDFALMMHPSTQNVIGRGALAAQGVTARYRGRAVHSASPEKGINALTSLIALFNGIDALRQVWPDTGRCNGIVTSGGTASNIVPELAEGRFTVRAGTKLELTAMVEGIRRAAQSAAALTGAELTFETAPLFAERYPNMTMGERFKVHLEEQGESVMYPNPKARVGSSDVGNVSMVVPTIHDYVSIAAETVLGHTDEFREAAKSPRADKVVLLAAQALALTGWDLATDEALRAQARKEFEENAAPNRC